MSNNLNGAVVLYNGKIRIEKIDHAEKKVHFVLHKPVNVSEVELFSYIMTGCAYLYNEGFIPEEEDLLNWSTHAEIVNIGESCG